jgi:hypothetical protein
VDEAKQLSRSVARFLGVVSPADPNPGGMFQSHRTGSATRHRGANSE